MSCSLFDRFTLSTKQTVLVVFLVSCWLPGWSSADEFDSTQPVSILLITGEEIADAWRPFADWKTSTGRRTNIITVQQIDDQYTADNVQEKIRLCVREHIEKHSTQWVILGGDCLPGGKGIVPGGHTTVHAQEPAGIPTDIVYLSPTNWDADGDGIYGEFEDDREAITYPTGDVGLGRIPVRTADDVAAFTKKVIAYESQYPTDGYAKQMIYTCTDQPAYPKVRNSWDGYLSKVWDGQVGRYFSQKTPWDEEGKPGSYPLSPDNLVKLFNEQSTSKIHIHGHGHLPAWILEGHSQFTGNHVKQLKNSQAYPLLTTVSCNTGEYDSKHDPSIVESMIRQPNAGSVAVVAPVRTGKPHFAKSSDFRLMVTEGKLDGTTKTMTRYWVVGMRDAATTGIALMKAKSEMAEDGKRVPGYHLCLCEINLLGDPSLDMRAQNPRQPELTAPDHLTLSQQTVKIATDAPNSTICLWKRGEIYEVLTADDDGKVSVSIKPASAGELTISVSGPNLNTVVRQISVDAAGS